MRSNSMVRCVVAVVVVLGAAVLSARPVQALDVAIDSSMQHQTIEGWGACLYPNEHSDSNSCYLWDSWRTAFREAGNNIIRLNVEPNIFMASGGTLEGPELPLTGDLATDAAQFNFEFSRFRYSDDLAAWLHQNALEPERAKIIGGIWSIPHWAKAPTGAFISQGQWSGGTPLIMYCDTCDTAGGTWDTGIYSQDRYQYCSRYLAAFCYGFEQHAGVPLYGLSIQNEVGYEQGFNSCTLLHEATATKGTRQNNSTTMNFNVYANALKAVKDEFALHGALDHIKLMGPHHANVGDSVANPWGLLWQTLAIDCVKDHADSALIGFLDVYTNNYGAPPAERAEMFRAYWEGIDSMPEKDWASDWGEGVEFPPTMHAGIGGDGKQTWNSEFGGHATDWAGALALAGDLHTQLHWGRQSAIVYWQFADPSLSEHCLLSESQLSEPTQSPKYCAWKQFSRHIRPGAKRVKAVFNESGGAGYGGADLMDDENAINVTAYVHGADGCVTIVFVNRTGTDHPVNVTVPSTPAISTYQVFRSSSTENYVQQADLSVSNGSVSVTVPAQSVVTLTGAGEGQNVAPVAYDDAYSTPMDVTLNVAAPGVLGNDTDANGDPLTAIKVSDPTSGSVTLNSDGSFTYTPAAGYTGDDSFTYKANDGQLDSNTATVTITVTSGNNPPTAKDDSYSTDKDTVLNVAAPGVLGNDSDPDGNELTAIKKSDPTNGAVVLNSDGSFEYTPNAGYEGTDSFTYVANDGLADSNTATVSITVVGSGSTMHVADVVAYLVALHGPRKGVRGDVLIHDEFGQPVEGATVYVEFTLDGSTVQTASAVTGSDGWAYCSGADGTWSTVTCCVTDVTHATMTYDPNANVETCDSN